MFVANPIQTSYQKNNGIIIIIMVILVILIIRIVVINGQIEGLSVIKLDFSEVLRHTVFLFVSCFSCKWMRDGEGSP